MAQGTVIESLVAEFRGDTSHLDGSVNRSLKTIRSFASGAGKTLGSLRRAFFSLQGAAAALGATLTFKGAIDTSVRLDQLANKMQAATKNADITADSFEFLNELTERLGLGFVDAADGFAGFSAAALRAGLTFKDTKQIFQDIATAATSMQLPAQQVGLIFRALEQIASKGVVQMEELKLQLGDSLPGALQIAAKSMGVTTGEFIKMIENGEVLAQDFLPKFGAAIKDELGGSAEEASQQLLAETNRMKNAFIDLQDEFADNGAGEAYKEVIGELADLFKDPDFIQGVKNLSKFIGETKDKAESAAGAVGDFAGAVIRLRELFPEMPQFVKDFADQFDNLDDKIRKASVSLNAWIDQRQGVNASYAPADFLAPYSKIPEDAFKGTSPLEARLMAQNPFGVSKLTEQQVKEIEDALKNSENYTLGGQGNGNAGPSDKELKEAAAAAKKYAAAVDKMEGALGDILEPAEKYRLTMEEINRISEEASFKEAARNLGLSEAEAKTRLMTKATDEYKDAIEEANQETVRARNEMADFFAEGMQGWDSFRDAAVNALQDVLRNMLRVAMGGSAEDSIFGNIGGGLGGLISGGISSLFGGFDFTSQAGYKPGFYGPGFATGGSIMEDRATGGPDNQMVTLRKSRNERLTISRPGQKNMGQSGNAVTVQQNINVTTGVQQTVRAELARYMPQIKEQAVRAVDEAISRSVMRGS